MPAHYDDLFQQTIDRFWETVPPVWSTVRSQIRTTAAHQFDISEEQFHILRHIRRGAHSASQLAEAGRISRPAISQALDALVEKNLVTRRQSTSDRRYVELELTSDGTALLDAIFGQARAWMRKKLSTLKEDEMQDVMSALSLLKEAFCG
jgi:DNA-binding MarR family transcriptional regulator